jgi:predicted PurR-regulated permease PerM
MFEKNGANSISISNGTIIRIILILAFAYLLWILRDLILVVLTSIVIASFIEFIVPRFKKIGIGRVFGVVIIYVISISLLATLFYLLAPLLITEVYNFASFISQYAPGVDFLNYFNNEAFSGAKDIVTNISGKLSVETLLATSKAFINNLSSGFFTTLSVAFGSIVNVVLIIVISFYFSVQEKGIENFLRIILPLKYEEYVVDLWSRTERKIALWMRGQLLLGVLIAILTYLVLAISGIQYAFLLAIIAGVTELVPYGILIALAIAVTFSYLSGGVAIALFVLGAFLIIHLFEIYLFSPLVIKKATGLSPLIIILAVLIGVELGGFWGLVLSIPATMLFMEIMNDIEKNKTTIREKNLSR